MVHILKMTVELKILKKLVQISKKIQILELNFFQNDCRAHLWSSVVIFYSGKKMSSKLTLFEKLSSELTFEKI